MNFQNGQPIRMEFLPEALANSGRKMLPPFAECIVLGTLFGRCTTHRWLTLTPTLPSKESREFWSKHEWLSTTIEKRKQLLAQDLPSVSLYSADPMLTFAHALAHCAVIYL